MDGFSPPPMSDFSPPPLSDLSPLREFPPPIPLHGFPASTDDIEDGGDGDYDFAVSDADYDLTGLSDKLNSLELDKINNLPPREILELKKESTQVSSLYTSLNSNNQNGVSESINEPTSELNTHSDITPEPELPNTEMPPDVGSESEGDDHNALENNCDVANSNLDKLVVDSCPKEDEKPPDDITGEATFFSESSAKENNMSVDDKSEENSNLDAIVSQSSITEDEKPLVNHIEEVQASPKCEEVQMNDVGANEDCWGDFSTNIENNVNKENEEWSNFESGPGEDWTKSNDDCPPSVETKNVDDLKFDDSDDDDFGDFGAASDTVVKEENLVSGEHSILETLRTLSDSSDQLLRTVFTLGVGGSDGSEDVDSPALDLLALVLAEGAMFETISNPASCPALDHQWRDSAAHQLIMATLGIDSRVLVSNIIFLSQILMSQLWPPLQLDGESWRSSVPKYAPKHAASLVTPGLLTPEPAAAVQEADRVQVRRKHANILVNGTGV